MGKEAFGRLESKESPEWFDRSLADLRQRYNDAVKALSAEAINLLREWPERLKSITDEFTEYQVRGKVDQG